MTAGPHPAPGIAPTAQALRQLRGSLHGATDGQLTQVLAMIDALAERGDADALIAPLRPRLAQLRPQRAMTWKRLLFVPLDPLIQPPGQWRRGSVGVPRSALDPIANLVLSDTLALCRQRWGGDPPSPIDDPLGADAAGADLWPDAARALEAAVPPPGWQAASGLGLADFPPLRDAIASVLRHAADMQPIVSRAAMSCRGPASAAFAEPADLATLQAMLADAAGTGTGAALLAVMLARLPNAAELLCLPFDRAMSDQALDFVLDRLDMVTGSEADIADAADEVARAAALLDALLDPGPAGRPSRRARLQAMRRALDAQCRTRMAATLTNGVVTPLAEMGAHAAPLAIETIERAARAVRRFAAAGRGLGGTEWQNTLLQHAADTVADTSTTPLVDRVRLIEILVGPDAALQTLRTRA